MPVTPRLVQTPCNSDKSRDWWRDRIRSSRHHDVVGGMAHAIHFDNTYSSQPANTAQQSNALGREPALLAGIGVVGNHVIAPRKRRGNVNLGSCRRFARLVNRLPRAQQRLGRDTRPVRALATHQSSLHKSNPKTAVRQLARTVLAWRTAAYDNDVIAAHVRAPWLPSLEPPACSCTMYCAYQSGQSGSGCPISAS